MTGQCGSITAHGRELRIYRRRLTRSIPSRSWAVALPRPVEASVIRIVFLILSSGVNGLSTGRRFSSAGSRAIRQELFLPILGRRGRKCWGPRRPRGRPLRQVKAKVAGGNVSHFLKRPHQAIAGVVHHDIDAAKGFQGWRRPSQLPRLI
jgi:hypothetical protein